MDSSWWTREGEGVVQSQEDPSSEMGTETSPKKKCPSIRDITIELHRYCAIAYDSLSTITCCKRECPSLCKQCMLIP